MAGKTLAQPFSFLALLLITLWWEKLKRYKLTYMLKAATKVSVPEANVEAAKQETLLDHV